MKTIEQARRELFEAEYCKRNECGIDHMQKDGKFYQRDSAQIAWGWFNAALDAVVIELPPSVDMPDEEECGDYEEYEAMEAITCTANGVRHACRSAIESTNLGLKII